MDKIKQAENADRKEGITHSYTWIFCRIEKGEVEKV